MKDQLKLNICLFIELFIFFPEPCFNNLCILTTYFLTSLVMKKHAG